MFDIDEDKLYQYERRKKLEHEHEMDLIRYSNLNERNKAREMNYLERKYKEECLKRRHRLETYYNVEYTNGCGCLIAFCFLSLSTIFAGVGMAKTVSSAIDVKPSQSITQPCEKATLISKNKVVRPKSLDNEHLKN